jgi:hypothetical protein
MHNLQATGGVIRQVGFFALLGVAVVFLAGPVIAAVSVLFSMAMVVVSFALVGFVVWFPIQLVTRGPEAACATVRDAAQSIGKFLGRTGKAAIQALTLPAHFIGQIVSGAVRLGRRLGHFGLSAAKTLIEIGLITGTGVLVGAAVGTFISAQSHDVETTIAANALLGGGIGLLAGGAMAVLEKRKARQETSNSGVPA